MNHILSLLNQTVKSPVQQQVALESYLERVKSNSQLKYTLQSTVALLPKSEISDGVIFVGGSGGMLSLKILKN